MEKMDMRKIRDDFRKELAKRDGQMDRLYAELTNEFSATQSRAKYGLGNPSKDDYQRLDMLLSIAEGELAVAYLQEHGWQLGTIWERKKEQ